MHRMTTYKRRIVYLSDEEWATAQTRAQRYKLTISGYFRSLIVGGSVTPVSVQEDRERTERFNSRPFTPVPKRGK